MVVNQGSAQLSVQMIQVLISSAVAFLCVTFFSDSSILFAIIVFGQTHFLLTYFYVNKSGKIDAWYLKRFLFLLACVGSAAFFIFRRPEWLPWLIFVTAMIFATHYFTDEFRLFRIENIKNQLWGALAVTCSFSSVFVSKLFPGALGLSYIFAVAALLLAILFLYQNARWFLDFRKNLFFLVFFLVNIIVPLYAWHRPEFASINQVLGAIILFHYVHWYLYYVEKFQGKEFDFYLDVIFWGHVFIFLAFILYMLAPRAGIAYVFFDPTFFYGWTIIHILLTLRQKDYTLQI